MPGYVADRERLEAIAEPVDGPTVAAWREIAAEADGLVAGGFAERAGGELFNTAVVVGAEGVLLHYRKLHPFRAEKGCFTPGDLGLPVAQTRFGVVGVCVCYDLRFVETLRVLALRGAELVCVPTAWVAGFDTVRWDAGGYCPQARGAGFQANLDQVFVACASQVGPGADDLELLGSSIVADPYGRTVLGPLPRDEEELAIFAIDLDEIGRAHEREPLVHPREDRRTDVYAVAFEGLLL